MSGHVPKFRIPVACEVGAPMKTTRPKAPKAASAESPEEGSRQAPDLPRLLSVAEVGEIFGRAPRTIRSWIARGLLRPVKVGHSVFIPMSEVESLISAPKKRP